MEAWNDGGVTCKEFEGLIPGFFERKLDYPTLKRFLAHRDVCGDCREELAIQFLVVVGMQRLEDGSTFNLQSELNQRLEEAERRVRRESSFLDLGLAMEIVATCVLMGVFVWILL